MPDQLVLINEFYFVRKLLINFKKRKLIIIINEMCTYSLTCGTTWHAAGLVGRLKSTSLTTAISCYSRDLYRDLEREDLYTGYKENGALYLARTKDRMVAYTRYLQSARYILIFNVEDLYK